MPVQETAPQQVTKLKQSERTSEESDALRFDQLPLHPGVKKSVAELGYTHPTPIQAKIIPHVLDGRDVLAQSETGSGKTAAFALPILSKISGKAKKPQVLVLAPTRELAGQVAKSFTNYSQHLSGTRITAIYGGQDYESQLRQLKQGTQIIVGTPGRILDHLKRGSLDLSNVRHLVLDEADEMLNMGFLEDVEEIIQYAPEDRQIALFSATMPPAIRGVAETYLNDPQRIRIKQKTATATSIQQRAVFVQPKEKIQVLKKFLEVEQTDGVIVFTKTKEATLQVSEKLTNGGFRSIALNGDMPQKVRERSIAMLKSGKLDILVATDVAARGLDVPRISHVFNFDLPHDSEAYIHRVGRTGRAGRTGTAIIFLSNSQRRKLQLIERATKQPIDVVHPPSADEVNAGRIERFKSKIDRVAENADLSFFKSLIQEHVAAATVSISCSPDAT
ncbi:MAG: DEAD/DEAH box helicase, partial [Planctomycetota bacterium]